MLLEGNNKTWNFGYFMTQIIANGIHMVHISGIDISVISGLLFVSTC